MIADTEAEAALRRQHSGCQVLGASAVRGQHPFDRPARPKKSPAPLFHAVSKRVRQKLSGLPMRGLWQSSAMHPRSFDPETGWRGSQQGASLRPCRLWPDRRFQRVCSPALPCLSARSEERCICDADFLTKSPSKAVFALTNKCRRTVRSLPGASRSRFGRDSAANFFPIFSIHLEPIQVGR
jgi:hypothetical protein